MPPHRLRPLDLQHGVVELAHGSGGRATQQLIVELFQRHFGSPQLTVGHDAGILPPPSGRLAVSTDCFVVSPLFFPGGCIGDLAVHGSINDVAMAGAQPLGLTVGFVLEEGFPLAQLDRIAAAVGTACERAAVPIISGDTKVVERGKADGVFLCTTCVGIVPSGVQIAPQRACPHDVILVSGTVGDHGTAILSQREGIAFETDIISDSAPLHTLVAAMLDADPDLHVLRDPTRGGVAAALNEIAASAQVGMQIDEAAIPVHPAVRSACDLLGLDPLHLACEGRLLAVCDAASAPRVLAKMQAHPLGRNAAVIGNVVPDRQCFVELRTPYGGRRILDWPAGEQLPRIC